MFATLEEALWSRVTKSGDCWEWKAGTTAAGYGEFMFRGKMLYAHRVAYELHFGPIPAGKKVRHKCDNPPCCRPDHLLIGTQADNVRDMIERGRDRKAVGLDHGRSKLDPEKIRKIRIMRTEGISFRKIGAAFGVDNHTIRAIISGMTWNHVHG